MLTAQQAEQYDIANRVVPAAEFAQKVDTLAQTLAPDGTLAFTEAKRCYRTWRPTWNGNGGP